MTGPFAHLCEPLPDCRFRDSGRCRAAGLDSEPFGYVLSAYRVCEPVGALRRGGVERAVGVVASEGFPSEFA